MTQRNFPKPLSIFISAKTGYISLRQGMEPVAEGAAVIAGRNRPVGNYVFTATGWRDESHTKLNWSVVAANDKGDNSAPRGRESDAGRLPPPTSAIKVRIVDDIARY